MQNLLITCSVTAEEFYRQDAFRKSTDLLLVLKGMTKYKRESYHRLYHCRYSHTLATDYSPAVSSLEEPVVQRSQVRDIARRSDEKLGKEHSRQVVRSPSSAPERNPSSWPSHPKVFHSPPWPSSHPTQSFASLVDPSSPCVSRKALLRSA